MAKANYNCTEQELYTICETAWNSCTQQLADFTAFKSKYVSAFVTGKQAAVLAARNLPDEQQRNASYETASIQLRQLGRTCCDKWQLLKRYIADAYPTELQKPMLEAAGYNYYDKAANNNWDSVKGLMTSGSTFIVAELPNLTAGGNMPLSFQTDFNTAKTNFETQHQNFLQAEEDSRVGQDTKINANNTIHADLMSMLLDGQEIFKNNEPIYKQFVFAELLYLASGVGTAGVKGQITNEANEASLENITVSISGTTKTTVSIEKGFYEINQVAAGKYNITFEGEGFETLIIKDWIVKVGTVSTLDVKMKPKP